ncbi:POT family proton-dependent oligopeptide transporter [Saccharothrix tamanrassetensis]|uniref:POT family proton-dependent oligopeptide transporter n=1 Tax=Saccharothrix tamanrassetensis TaxID=1051531 RepID=A0A841CN79_9PSEU|nr:peptide MFS transporter [Saccharothrix tamanrassetensis]MBB5957445.1 POT family proton-dependent oligopeptide transporter [Saccharothrix tamanrassetensis]
MTATAPPRTVLGQPHWFRVLFVVDVWERFSFYGMLAILYLYLVAPVAEGGLGLRAGAAATGFGTYLALNFLAALPGGWVADRVLGRRRAVLVGGAVIACGHGVLALPVGGATAVGLGLVIVGTGLVKPSIAAMIGEHHRSRERREAAMSVFYMSVQISALIAPLVTGLLADRVGWHAAFGAAALGMAVGVVLYARGMHRLGDIGAPPSPRVAFTRQHVVLAVASAAAVVLLVAAGFAAPVLLAVVGVVVLVLPFVCLRRLRRHSGVDPAALRALAVLMTAAALFWGLFAQGGALLSLFAKESTDRSVLGHVVPAGWFQSLPPLFLLVGAPVAAWLWLRLGGRANPAGKASAGLLLAGAGFLVMASASLAASDGPVTPWWLVAVYLLLACGELAIGPIVLSAAAGTAPPGYEGRFVGLSWLFVATGVVVAAQLARLVEVVPGTVYFLGFGVLAVLAGVLLALVRGRPRG